MPPPGPVTLLIMIVTGLVSFYAFNNPEFRAKALFVPAAIKRNREYYRFISSGFIHADLMHLIFNMYALYIFGRFAEPIFGGLFGSVGGVAFLIFYVVAIAAANYVSYQRHQDDYHYRALGASGAVSAVMWPFILYAPWAWFAIPPLPAWLMGIGYIAYSHYADGRRQDGIGHSAHLWGAIFGLTVYVTILVAMPEEPDLLQRFFDQIMKPEWPGRS